MTKVEIPRPFHQVIANLYEPDVFTFQIGQDITTKEKPHTTLVCTGIGPSVLEVILDFESVVGFVSKPLLSKEFEYLVRLDQVPLYAIYDMAVNHRINPKFLLAESLRGQQETYRVG